MEGSIQVLIRSPFFVIHGLFHQLVCLREMDLSIYVGICSLPSVSVIATVFQPFMYCTKTFFCSENIFGTALTRKLQLIQL